MTLKFGINDVFFWLDYSKNSLEVQRVFVYKIEVETFNNEAKVIYNGAYDENDCLTTEEMKKEVASAVSLLILGALEK